MLILLTFALVGSLAGGLLSFLYRTRFQGADARHRPPNYYEVRRILNEGGITGCLCGFACLWYLVGWMKAWLWLITYVVIEILVQHRSEARFLRRTIRSLGEVFPDDSERELQEAAIRRLWQAKDQGAGPNECL